MEGWWNNQIKVNPTNSLTEWITLFKFNHPFQTGVSEVFLEVRDEDLKKERMRKFVEAVKDSGLNLSEGAPYKQLDPHRSESNFNKRFKPWEVIDE